MATIVPTDCLDVIEALLTESMHRPTRGNGYPTVPPRYAVRCSRCTARVEAELQICSMNSTRYVLPVDSEGRCSSCVLTLCLTCDGKPGGCKDCEYTGQASR